MDCNSRNPASVSQQLVCGRLVQGQMSQLLSRRCKPHACQSLESSSDLTALPFGSCRLLPKDSPLKGAPDNSQTYGNNLWHLRRPMQVKAVRAGFLRGVGGAVGVTGSSSTVSTL